MIGHVLGNGEKSHNRPETCVPDRLYLGMRREREKGKYGGYPLASRSKRAFDHVRDFGIYPIQSHRYPGQHIGAGP
jgi:hypothetical protein